MSLLALDYASLNDKFTSILKYPVSLKEAPEETLLTISGFPSYENVWSNIYKYFLNEQRAKLNQLFLFSLQDCVKGVDINMEKWIAEREVMTKKGRIDLVIREGSSKSKIILIENKVYHTLNNDLPGYFEGFADYDQRILILLSLHEVEIDAKFFNVTHKQWIQSIKNRLGFYVSKIETRQLIFLQDFIKHVESFYEKLLDMEAYKFLFENAEKINALNGLQNEAKSQLEKEILEQLPNQWEYYRTANNSLAVQMRDTGFVLYVTMDGLFKAGDHHYNMQLWLKGESFVKKWKHVSMSSTSDGIQIHKNESTKEWVLVASKRYIIDINGLQNFGELISKQLKNDWNPFCEGVTKHIA